MFKHEWHHQAKTISSNINNPSKKIGNENELLLSAVLKTKRMIWFFTLSKWLDDCTESRLK